MQSRNCWKMENNIAVGCLSGGPFHPRMTVDDGPFKQSAFPDSESIFGDSK